jgi:hypothetical protein
MTEAAVRVWRGTLAAGSLVATIVAWILCGLWFSFLLIARMGWGICGALWWLASWVREQNVYAHGWIYRLISIAGVLLSSGFVIHAVTAQLAVTQDDPAAGVTPVPPTNTPVMLLRRARVIQIGTMGLVVRATPAGSRIGKLANGTTVEVIAGPVTVADPNNPTWWHVRRGNLAGWVSSHFLTFED